MRLLVQVQPGLPLKIKFENLKKILYNIYTINELLKLNNNLITVIVQFSADLTP